MEGPWRGAHRARNLWLVQVLEAIFRGIASFNSSAFPKVSTYVTLALGMRKNYVPPALIQAIDGGTSCEPLLAPKGYENARTVVRAPYEASRHAQRQTDAALRSHPGSMA